MIAQIVGKNTCITRYRSLALLLKQSFWCLTSQPRTSGTLAHQPSICDGAQDPLRRCRHADPGRQGSKEGNPISSPGGREAESTVTQLEEYIMYVKRILASGYAGELARRAN